MVELQLDRTLENPQHEISLRPKVIMYTVVEQKLWSSWGSTLRRTDTDKISAGSFYANPRKIIYTFGIIKPNACATFAP